MLRMWHTFVLQLFQVGPVDPTDRGGLRKSAILFYVICLVCGWPVLSRHSFFHCSSNIKSRSLPPLLAVTCGLYRAAYHYLLGPTRNIASVSLASASETAVSLRPLLYGLWDPTYLVTLMAWRPDTMLGDARLIELAQWESYLLNSKAAAYITIQNSSLYGWGKVGYRARTKRTELPELLVVNEK